MAGWIQSLLIAGAVSATGLVLRMLSILGPAPIAWAISVAAGVATFIATAILLGIGLALALFGLI